MQTTTLGKTGLQVSVLGLGGGGFSKLGLARGGETTGAVRLVRRALELGITLFDTAESYGTETIFGEALADEPRERITICSKAGIGHRQPKDLHTALEQSLQRLRTDYLDLYQIHGLTADEYPRAVRDFLPVLEEARQQGKIRFLGVTEAFERETRHEMARLALAGPSLPPWDCLMIGYNLLNPSAALTVFPQTRKFGIGVLGMFAVRHALIDEHRLRETLLHLRAEGAIAISDAELLHPLGFLLEECATLAEAAYRFCRHTPGMDCLLCGTGSIPHLEANVASANLPPLSPAALARLAALFGKVDQVSGNPRKQ